MKLLPSEQKERVVDAVQEFLHSGSISIFEPCDCGNRIQHNNGGNYHERIHLQQDGEQVFVKRETTCEFDPPAEWELCEDWEAVIKQNADWL